MFSTNLRVILLKTCFLGIGPARPGEIFGPSPEKFWPRFQILSQGFVLDSISSPGQVDIGGFLQFGVSNEDKEN